MHSKAQYIIGTFVALTALAATALPADAQVVGSSTMAGLSNFRSGAAMPSSGLASFRMFSTGSEIGAQRSSRTPTNLSALGRPPRTQRPGNDYRITALPVGQRLPSRRMGTRMPTSLTSTLINRRASATSFGVAPVGRSFSVGSRLGTVQPVYTAPRRYAGGLSGISNNRIPTLAGAMAQTTSLAQTKKLTDKFKSPSARTALAAQSGLSKRAGLADSAPMTFR